MREFYNTVRTISRKLTARNVSKVRDAFFVVRSRLLSVPVVHAIGDSQTGVLVGVWPFVVHHIGPVTAYNLGSSTSSSQSCTRLLDAIDLADPHRDIVLLIAGGVDCRIHIYDQHMRSSGELTLQELARRTVVHYGEAIEMVKVRGFQVAVQSAAGAVHQNNFYGYAHYADIITRGHIAKLFNAELEIWCRKHDVYYVDLFSYITDDRGVLNKSVVSDGVHLNRKILHLYGPWIRKVVYSRWVAP